MLLILLLATSTSGLTLGTADGLPPPASDLLPRWPPNCTYDKKIRDVDIAVAPIYTEDVESKEICKTRCDEAANCGSFFVDETDGANATHRCRLYNVNLHILHDHLLTGWSWFVEQPGNHWYSKLCAHEIAHSDMGCNDYSQKVYNNKYINDIYFITETTNLLANVSAESCQRWCSLHVSCMSVAHEVRNADGAAGCILYNTSVQAEMSKGEHSAVIKNEEEEFQFTTYDRMCPSISDPDLLQWTPDNCQGYEEPRSSSSPTTNSIKRSPNTHESYCEMSCTARADCGGYRWRESTQSCALFNFADVFFAEHFPSWYKSQSHIWTSKKCKNSPKPTCSLFQDVGNNTEIESKWSFMMHNWDTANVTADDCKRWCTFYTKCKHVKYSLNVQDGSGTCHLYEMSYAESGNKVQAVDINANYTIFLYDRVNTTGSCFDDSSSEGKDHDEYENQVNGVPSSSVKRSSSYSVPGMSVAADTVIRGGHHILQTGGEVVQTVRSQIDCAGRCVELGDECRGYNYNQGSKTCELLDTNYMMEPDKMTDTGNGYVHYTEQLLQQETEAPMG